VTNPLGQYSSAVAAVVSVLVIASAILVHVLQGCAVLTAAADTSWLDNAALLALGVVIGSSPNVNGSAKWIGLANSAANQEDRITALEMGAKIAAAAAAPQPG
jgi:hypothetical protein